MRTWRATRPAAPSATPRCPQDVTVGDTILLDDGLVRLTVLETTNKTIRCRVENDGTMKNHKGRQRARCRCPCPT